MYKLPEGEYTICIKFIPVTINNVSVGVASTSLNINKQSTNVLQVILELLLLCINSIFHISYFHQSTLWLI